MSAWCPLRLTPIVKPRLWGGTALRDHWGKSLPTDEPYGESWELTWRGEDTNRIYGGPHHGQTLEDIAQTDRVGVLGTRLASLVEFPLLAKLLDCRQRLSVQVHPTAEYARTHPGAQVKMEAWYVLDAPAGASLVFGLLPGTTRVAFARAIDAGRVPETLAHQRVSTGDVLLVRPGTVHALLEGLMVYEIQQSSDTTFRVYDWDRVDADGQPRELHVQQALDCIDFDAPPPGVLRPLALDEQRDLLVATPAFALERVRVSGEWSCAFDGSRCEVLTVIDGEGTIAGVAEPIRPGTSIFVPAGVDRFHARGALTFLRAFVPEWDADVWTSARNAGHADAAIRTVCGGVGPDAAAT